MSSDLTEFFKKKHHRKSIRLKGYDYSSNGGYFVTICVKNRECLFGEIINGEMNLSEIGQIAYNNWIEIQNNFNNVEIDEFVIMPNHLHGIILINSEDKINHESSSGNGLMNQTPANQNHVINGLQSTNDSSFNICENNISGKYNLMLNPKITLGKIIRHFKAKTSRIIRKNNHEYFQWQQNYHEWIIRDEKHLDRFRNYIYQNPLKWEIDSENPDKKQNNESNKNNIIQESLSGRGLIHQPLANQTPANQNHVKNGLQSKINVLENNNEINNEWNKNNFDNEILSGRGLIHQTQNKHPQQIINHGTNNK